MGNPFPVVPTPRQVAFRPGTFSLPRHPILHLEASLPRETVLLPVARRLADAVAHVGDELELVTGPASHPRLAIRARQDSEAPDHPEGYRLLIGKQGVQVHYRQIGGLRAATATLRQLLRHYGRDLPCLEIRDYPDFERRGVMLDISRGRVPKLQTLLDLVGHLADFKINEFQLYTEHTFAYRNYEPVWRGWGPLTGEDILQLDAACRELGIDLVPNQNTFGHLRYWLEYTPLAKLAEVSEPYESADRTYVRYPTTLAPRHPGTLPFLRGLLDEFLPHFTSSRFNAGCDETWDLGRGQSKRICAQIGEGRVYLEFLKKIRREVSLRGRQMMFWGDIVLNHPQLIRDLPRDIVALNWGYEASHPFAKEARLFANAKIPFYVCPGTSTWMSFIGRHDNGLANLRRAAEAGLKYGAIGFLNTDWGDGGHPQPLAVSYIPYLAGAALSWCAKTYHQGSLLKVLSRDIFLDPTERMAAAAMQLGLAHRLFKHSPINVTPFGTVLAAPLPSTRELTCRDGLKYYARIKEANIIRAMEAVEEQRRVLYRSKPVSESGEVLALELDLAARMAVQSCQIMLWQQALARAKTARAQSLALKGIRDLTDLEIDFKAYWPLRNNGNTAKCSPFFKWRREDYQRAILHFPPEAARIRP